MYIKQPLKIILSVFIFLFLFVSSCKKKNSTNPEPTVDIPPIISDTICENFPEFVAGVSLIKQKQNQKHAPCFNPRNNDEFIYLDAHGNSNDLVKYNLASKTELMRIENINAFGQPKWNNSGLIVFIKSDLQVYLIKDNGDSLQKVTTYFSNSYPSFYGKNRIFFGVGQESSPPGASGNKLIDLQGVRIDSTKAIEIGGTFGVNDINSSLEIATWDGKSIGIFDFSLKEYTSLFSFTYNGRNNVEGICWHPSNNEIFYSTYREGIFKVAVQSKERTRIRAGCDSRSYRYLSVSPNGQKIITERVDATNYQNTSGSWTEEAKIYIMNSDGTNEKLLFP